MNAKKYLAVVMAGLLGGAPFVYAANSKTEADSEIQNIQANVSQATISLTAAITAAEAHTNGKAVEAELDDEGEQAAYKIEVINDGKLTDVTVDSRTGQVTTATADRPDNDDDDEDDES